MKNNRSDEEQQDTKNHTVPLESKNQLFLSSSSIPRMKNKTFLHLGGERPIRSQILQDQEVQLASKFRHKNMTITSSDQ